MELRGNSQIFIFLTLFLAWANFCAAGFGISPPYILNDKLLPGSHHEQRITVVRSDDSKDDRIQVVINAPEIASWITLDPGADFVFPAGKKYMYLTAKIDAPSNAEKKQYKGTMAINLIESKEGQAGGATVALGAQVDIDITVGEGAIKDFSVFSIKIPDFNENRPMKILLGIENKGNVRIAPSRVEAEIYDISGQNFVTTLRGSRFEEVESFARKEIASELDNSLKQGSYWSIVKIYKENEIVREEKIFFTILEKLPEVAPLDLGKAARKFDFKKIFNVKPDILVLASVLAVIIIIVLFLVWPRKRGPRVK